MKDLQLILNKELQAKVNKLQRENNWVVSENVALRTKIDLLESQLKSREDTIRLQAKLFVKEKEALKSKNLYDLLQERTSSENKQNSLQNEEQANVDNSNVMTVQSRDGINIDEIPHEIFPSTNNKTSVWDLEQFNGKSRDMDKIKNSVFKVEPSYVEIGPKAPLVSHKKRKKCPTADEQYTSGFSKESTENGEVSSMIEDPDNRQKVPSPLVCHLCKKTKFSTKVHVLECFSQLPERTGNVDDICSLMEQFGKYKKCTIRSSVSVLSTSGRLRKLPRGKHGLTMYRLLD